MISQDMDDFPILRCCCHSVHTLTFKNKAGLLGKLFINSHSDSAGFPNPIPTVAMLYMRRKGNLECTKEQILRVETLLVH